MSRIIVLALAVLGCLSIPGHAFAQLTPPAGSAGAGNAPISGIPYGPANPRILSDPSGIGNAASVPSPRTPGPTVPWTATAPATAVTPTSPSRVVTPRSYPTASQEITGTHAVEPRRKGPPRRRGHPQVSTFTGICRGC